MRAAGADRARCERSAAWLRGAQNARRRLGHPAAGAAARRTRPAPRSRAWSPRGRRAGRATRGAAGCAGRSARAAAGRSAARGVVNSQSTAWAVQGLVAIGRRARTRSTRALGYLARLRAPDGHYRYSASSDQTPIWVTAQVLLAVERQPFPLAGRAARADPQPGRRRAVGRRRRREARARAPTSPSQPTGSAPSTGGGQSVAPAPPASARGSGADDPERVAGAPAAGTPSAAGRRRIGGDPGAGGASVATAGAEPGASAPDASAGRATRSR